MPSKTTVLAVSTALALVILASASGDTTDDKYCSKCMLEQRQNLRESKLLEQLVDLMGYDPRKVDPSVFNINEAMRAVAIERYNRTSARVRRDAAHRAGPVTAAMRLGEAAADGSEAIDFLLSEATRASHVISAELAVYLRRTSTRHHTTVAVNVFQNDNGEKGEHLGVLNARIPVGDNHHELVYVDLNTILLEQIFDKGAQLSVFVEAIKHDVNLAVVPGDEHWKKHRAAVDLELGAAKHGGFATAVSASRRRRDAATRAAETAEALKKMELEDENVITDVGGMRVCGRNSYPWDVMDRCCLYDHVIKFKDLNWNFIIAPLEVNVMVCSGKCKTEVEETAHRITRNSAIGYAGICCHPTEYIDLAMVYVTETGEIKTGKIENFVATRCSCS